MILNRFHIARTRIIELGINGLYIGNNLGGTMRVLDPLQLVPLGKEDTER